MQTVAVARNAMATRFEVVMHGEDAVALRAAGEEALAEIERVEAQLSVYQPTSEIARLNALAARGPMKVTPGLFRLLQQAKRLHEETGGVFDITIGPLLRCWGFVGGTGKLPEPAALAEAREQVGMRWIELDEASYTVRFGREGVMLDLGAIGKGYAVERAAELLREAGVASALINGGTSTIYALGQPPGGSWKVAIEHPAHQRPDGKPKPVATVELRDEALSVSAVWGKSFEAEGKTFGHVLDPRTGEPAENAMLAAVILPSATETDALSTALLVVGEKGHEPIAELRQQMRTLVMGGLQAEGGLSVKSRGICVGAANVR